MRQIILMCVGLALGGCNADVQPTYKNAWWDPAYRLRRPIEIDPARLIGRSLDEFPLLVRIDRADVGLDLGEDPDIMRFVDADGQTVLDFEIERAGPALYAWVRIPRLSSNAGTTLFVYYGNPNATPTSGDVWTASGYQAVYHMATDLTEGIVADSTGTSDGATTMSPSNRTPALVGFGYDFGGLSDSIEAPHHPALGFEAGDEFGLSLWMKAGPSGLAPLVNKLQVPTPGYSIFKASCCLGLSLLGDTVRYAEVHGTTAINDDTWHHVAAVSSGSGAASLALYVDGFEETATIISDTLSGGIGTQEPLRIGVRGTGGSAVYFDGVLDELRVRAGPVSQDWLATEVENQSDPASFAVLGEEQPPVPRD